MPEVGERVRIHPASDWFMMGEKYATVKKIDKDGLFQVQGDRSGKKWWEPLKNLMDLNGNLFE